MSASEIQSGNVVVLIFTDGYEYKEVLGVFTSREQARRYLDVVDADRDRVSGGRHNKSQYMMNVTEVNPMGDE